MTAIFFDTSALIRRYHRTEPGAERIRTLCLATSRNTLLISRLTPVEVASALNRLFREGNLDREATERLWRLFRGHCRAHYRLLGLDEPTYLLGERLLFTHRLRAYDALQIASAVRTRSLLRDLTPDYLFCTADRSQAEAADREGLAVELIS